MLLIAISAIVLAGCSNTPPSLIRVDYEIMTVSDGTNIEESINLFVACNDENGVDDIQEVQVINERKEYAWVLSEGQYTSEIQGNLNWLAVMSIDPRLIDVTRGVKLEVRVVDYAGMQDQRSIHVSAPPIVDAYFPKLTMIRDEITISSRLFPVYIQSFDDVYQEYFVFECMKNKVSVSELIEKGYNTRYPLYASIFDQQSRRYYRFGPFFPEIDES